MNIGLKNINNIDLYKKKKIQFKHIFLKAIDILKTSPTFILFSLLNVTIPIFITLLASTYKNGAYSVIGVGYITTFQLAFTQLSFTFGVFASFLIYQSITKRNKIKLDNNVINECIFLSIIIGIILSPLYIGSTYVYNKYSNAHTNTIDSLDPGYNYIYSSFMLVLFFPLKSLLLMSINNKRQWLAFVLELFANILMIGFASILGLLTNLKELGIGLGISIGSIISIIIFAIVFVFLYKNDFIKEKINFKNIKSIINFCWRQMFVVLTIQIFKAAALISLSIKIPDKINGAVPLDYQMARLIWYNGMYIIPLFIMGMIDTTFFYFFKNKNVVIKNVYSISFIVSIFCVLISIIIAIAFGYCVEPLAKKYIENSEYTFDINQIKTDIQPLINQTIDEKLGEFINFISPQFKKIIKEIISNMVISKFTGFNGSEINNMINLPGSETYIYLSIYCILYPIGMLLNTFRLSITNDKPKWFWLAIAQALAITFVVEFGIKYQTTSKYYLMAAWSFPLPIIGVIAFTYLLSKFLIKIKLYESKKQWI